MNFNDDGLDINDFQIDIKNDLSEEKRLENTMKEAPDTLDLVDKKSNGSIEEDSTDYKTKNEFNLIDEYDKSTEEYENELFRDLDKETKKALIELLDMYPEYALKDIADLLE